MSTVEQQVKAIVAEPLVLLEFAVRAVTEGIDALAEVGAAVAVAVPVAAGAPTCRQRPSEACSQTVIDVCDERSCVTWSQVSATPMGHRTSVQRHSRSMTAPA